jgi:hypothetical protein
MQEPTQVVRLERASPDPAAHADQRPSGALRLARLVRDDAGGWRVSLGSGEDDVTVDPSVDERLLEDGARRGVLAVLERSPAGEWVVAGLLVTQQSLTVNERGDVEAHVRRFRLTADEEVLLRGAGAFLQLKLGEAELYANRILCRARELVRVLGRMIKLN